MVKDLFDYKYELLLREMDALQAGIRNYDSILFTIKGWAITVFSAIVVLVANQRDTRYLGLAAIAVVLFWALDAINKSFQRSYIVRYNRIEHYLRREFPGDLGKHSMSLNVPDIGARVSVKDVKAKTDIVRGALFIHTAILYVTMLVLLGIMSLFF